MLKGKNIIITNFFMKIIIWNPPGEIMHASSADTRPTFFFSFQDYNIEITN